MTMEPTMRARLLAVGCSLLMAVTVKAALAASTEVDFKTAIAAAEAAEKDAGALKNQWTATEQALAAAKKAATAGDFDTAVKQANFAESLAKASIAQAKEQETAWRAGVIR
jgi:hypothetical protein